MFELTGRRPYLWLDATYLQARDRARVVNKTAIAEGRREVLALAARSTESEAIWREFLRRLTKRGLAGIQLAIADAHEMKGLKGAVAMALSSD